MTRFWKMEVSNLQYACIATMASLALFGLLALATRPLLTGAAGALPLGVVALEVAAIVDETEFLKK